MFPYRLKQLREDAELTQSKLADMLYLTQSTIAYYENGKKAPTLDNAIAIAKTLNVSMDYLCGLTNNYQAYLAKTDPSPIEQRLKLAEGLSDDNQKLLESYIDYLLYKEEKNQAEIKYHKLPTDSPLVYERESNTIDGCADYIQTDKTEDMCVAEHSGDYLSNSLKTTAGKDSNPKNKK